MIEIQQPALDHSSRTLLDVTPVHTPVQGVRDVSSTPLPVVTSARVSTPECACSRLALPSLKGVTRIYVEDQPTLTKERLSSYVSCLWHK